MNEILRQRGGLSRTTNRPGVRILYHLRARNDICPQRRIMDGLPQVTVTEFATRESVVRTFVQRHADWIVHTLGCRIDETILLELEFPIVQLASMQLLSEVPLLGFQTTVMQKLKKLTESVELPPDIFPAFRIYSAQSSSGLYKNRKHVLQAHWEDSPALIRFRGLSQPVVVAGIPVTLPQKPGDVCDCVIVKREVVSEFLQLIQKITARSRESRWCVYGDGARTIRTSGWEDLVLSESVVNLVRKDFESFLHREEWFRNSRLPFRRGYLLHGPPGNGKTSLIRAMLNTSGLNGYSIRLFQEHSDDAHLERMFRIAANSAPALVVIEDIDRAFAQLKEAYILAGQKAFERGTNVTGNDLLEGIRVLRGGMALVSDHKRKAGFGESLFHEPEINAAPTIVAT